MKKRPPRWPITASQLVLNLCGFCLSEGRQVQSRLCLSQDMRALRSLSSSLSRRTSHLRHHPTVGTTTGSPTTTSWRAGCWLAAGCLVGCWLAGCWLVAGCWLLAAGWQYKSQRVATLICSIELKFPRENHHRGHQSPTSRIHLLANFVRRFRRKHIL